MTQPAKDAAVLQPARLGAAGEALRRRLDRRHLLIAIAAAVLLHTFIILGFWLIDRLRIRDIGDWSGPILVKIGTPDALDSPLPDPGPLPDQSELPLEDSPVEPEADSAPAESSQAQPADSETDVAPATPARSEPSPASERTVPESPPAESTSSQSRAVPAPVPSRVQGDEHGNSYEMNFDGSEDEVGRAGAYEFITSYMPLPEILEGFLLEGITGTNTMTPDFILGELEKYWEPVFNEYSKKPGTAGIVPLKDRPYYLSLLTNHLNYDITSADWKTAGMRPVVVEFTVGLSEGKRGAELSDIVFKTRTNDPRVDEAIRYGLSRWVYYNKTDQPIKGRITYRFDR